MESPRSRRSRSARSPRRRRLVYVALASVVIVGGTAAGTVYVKAQAHSDVDAVASVSSTTTATATATGEATVESVVVQPTVDYDELLAEAMESVTVPAKADVSVAVLDLESGESATYGDAAFDTASIVKVDILATLLLQAQDEDRELTASEKSYAVSMIENSDNASASALWRIIGKAKGLEAANERFGLTGTEGGDDMLWGLTQTTATDQLTLLQQVFGDDSELTTESQKYLQDLMGEIAVDQHWGVSAAADGSRWELKNGWLPRSATGLWDINSIGRVTASNGKDYLVAVLSDGNTTKAKGISLVEKAAQVAVSVFTGESVDATESASASASASASQ